MVHKIFETRPYSTKKYLFFYVAPVSDKLYIRKKEENEQMFGPYNELLLQCSNMQSVYILCDLGELSCGLS